MSYNGSSSNGNGRTVDQTTAADGTDLSLRKRDSGDFVVVDETTGERVGDARTKQAGVRELEETATAFGNAERDLQRRGHDVDARGGEVSDDIGGSGGMSMNGGGFGGGLGNGLYDDSGDSASDGRGLFGGSGSDDETDRDTSSGGLFGGGGGFGGFGGSSGSERVRDPDSGEFAPKRREPTDFEMKRDSDGRFTGRADEDGGDDSSGFLGRFL